MPNLTRKGLYPDVCCHYSKRVRRQHPPMEWFRGWLSARMTERNLDEFQVTRRFVGLQAVADS